MRNEEAYRYTRLKELCIYTELKRETAVWYHRGFGQTDVTHLSKNKRKGSVVSSLICLTDFVKWDTALRDLFAQKALHAKDNVCNISITLSVESGTYSNCQSAHSLFVCLFLSVSFSCPCMIHTADVVIVFLSVHKWTFLTFYNVSNASRSTPSLQGLQHTTGENNSQAWAQGQKVKRKALVIRVNSKCLFTAIKIT